eukprot:207824_1
MQVTNLLSLCVYAEWCILVYAFLGMCALLLLVSKLYGVYSRHDDIRYLNFIYFVIFTLNFFTNSIILTLQIFERHLIILGIANIALISINKFAFDITTTVQSEQMWSKSPFISKQITNWFKTNEIPFTVLSFFFGPIGAITFVNSRLFPVDAFHMGVPHSMMLHFISDIFWKVLLLQRLPELCIQFTYLFLYGCDQYLVLSVVTTISTLLLQINIKCETKPIELLRKYLIHNTAYLMEIEGEEIVTKSNQCLIRPNAFKNVIAQILEVEQNCIELPVFEGISVHQECECNNKKVPKCYGLKMYIAVNTLEIPRRIILMKLKEAQTDGRLIRYLMDAWGLTEPPELQEIELVYNIGGDLVIPRARKQARSYSVLPMTINLQQKRIILQMELDESEPSF